MAAAETTKRAGDSILTGENSEAPKQMEQSESASSRRGTGSQAAGSSSSSRAPPTRTRGDDAALQLAWIAIGRGEEYVGPDDREQADLANPRSRGRGEKARKERLKREWQRVERAREEAEGADMELMPVLSPLAVSEPPQPPPPALPSPLPHILQMSAPTEGDWARIVDLACRPTLNGTIVRVGPWHADRSRWAARHAGETLLVRPVNLAAIDSDEAVAVDAHQAIERAAAAHDWVQLVGLTSEPELNGTVAKVGSWLADAGRWSVSCISGRLGEIRRDVLVRTANLRVVDAAEAAAADAEAAATRKTAAEAAAARAEAEEAERVAVETAAMEAEDAVSAYHGDDLPVSPLGRFERREDLLEHHGVPAPLDQAARSEEWEVMGESNKGAAVAWVHRTAVFCCVGHRARVGSEVGRLPHNVHATPAQSQWALAHVVEWTLHSINHVDFHVAPTLHCQECAETLFALQRHVPAAPLLGVPVSESELRAEMCVWHTDAERRSRRPGRRARPLPQL